MSHHVATFQESAIAFDRIIATASRLEPVIYRADDWFQKHIVPATKRYALAFLVGFAKATYLTFIAGQNASEWYQQWFYRYIWEAMPAIVEESQPLLCGVAYAGYLMPASEALQVVGKTVKGKLYLNPQSTLEDSSNLSS